MKKLLTLALAASMILAMSVNAFALGNYVLSTDEVGTEEEEPIADEPELPAEPTGWAEQKVNPGHRRRGFRWVAAAAAAAAGIGLVALKKRDKLFCMHPRPVFRTRDF